MALRGTLTHRKTRRLAKLMNIPLPCALGVMEALWHVTAARTPAGDIGRLSDQDIAEEMFWDDDAAALIGYLIAAEIVDEHPQFRLVIHGWEEHADQSTKRKVARRGMDMAGSEPPQLDMASQQLDTASESPAMPRTPEPEPVPEPEPEPVSVPVCASAAIEDLAAQNGQRTTDPPDFELQALRIVNGKGAFLDKLLGFGDRSQIRVRLAFHLRAGTEIREDDWPEAAKEASVYARSKSWRVTEASYATALNNLWENRRAGIEGLAPTKTRTEDPDKIAADRAELLRVRAQVEATREARYLA